MKLISALALVVSSLILGACMLVDWGNSELTSQSVVGNTTIEDPIPTMTSQVDLPILGPAPEISNEIWLNTDNPLRLSELRNQVILVNFWTFG